MKKAGIGWRDLALVYEQPGFLATEFELEYENAEWSIVGLENWDEFLVRSEKPGGLEGHLEFNDIAVYLANGAIVG